MDIYLLRHGIAVDREVHGFADDENRPLTPRGRRQLLKTVQMIEKREGPFDLILSSPLLRAKQTAEIAASALKPKERLQFSRALAPGARPKDLVADLNQRAPAAKAILLVGHEPNMSRLISVWVTGGDQLEMDFKKGGLAKLEARDLTAGKCATLAWLLTPKQMKWMV